MSASRFTKLNPWRGLGGLPHGVWVLFAATLVNRAGTMVLPFLVLYLTRSLGMSAARAGLVVAAYGAAALVAAPLSGKLCDRVGAIRIMRASLFLSGLVLLAFPFAKSYAAVLAAAAALALTAESFRPANMAIIGDLVSPAQRKTAFAVNRLAINLGMSVGPALGGFLAAFSFPSLFVVDGLTSLASALILVLASFPVVASAAAREASPAGSRALRDPYLLTFLLAGLLPVALVFFQHISAMPLFLVRDLALSEAAYGLFFSLNTVLIVLFEVPVNTATAHWPHRRSLALGAALTGLGFGALAGAWNGLTVAVTVVLWTAGEMFFFPAMAAYVTDLAPEERRGEYMGLAQMTMALAFMVGPWAGTALLERVGGRALWLVVLALGAAATLLLLRVRLPQSSGGSAASCAAVKTGPSLQT